MSASSRLVSVHECKSGWLGSSYGRSISFWPMVCPLAGSAHKCPGTKSSHAGSEILLSGNSALSCIAVNRQYDSSGLPELRRGRSRTLSLMGTNLLDWCMKRHVSLTARFVPGKLNVLADCLSRKGQIINTEWILNKGTLSQFSILGDPPLKSVHHEAEQSTSSVCFSIPRSTGMGSGRYVPVNLRE